MSRVLVIEDDDQMRAMIRQMLERVGHEVHEASDGESGVEWFGQSGADVAVVDLFLPEQNGWQTIHALQRVAPGIPVVIVSSGAALEAVRRGASSTLDDMQRRGVVRVLRKPFAWEALTGAVDALVGHQKPSKECQ